MTTPNREAIIEEATKIYMQRNHDVSCNLPEVDELVEGGTYEEARLELMRNEGYAAKIYLEELASEAGFDLVKRKHASEYSHNLEDFSLEAKETFTIDIEEALRSGVFVSGGKGTTKSNLAMIIADMLKRKGITVKVFDISRAWQKRSSIPNLVEVDTNSQLRLELYQSVIFDLSRLTPQAAKDFITRVLEVEWRLQIDTPEEERKQIVYVFEEVQMLLPQGMLRSSEAQVILRLLTVGRNFQLGFIAITQRPALTDTSVFELSFQRYFARMDGQNDLKKIACYIETEKAKQLQSLKLGQFFYDKGTETKLIKTSKFESKVKPSKVQLAQPIEKVEKKEEHKETTETDLLRLASIALQVGALAIFLLVVMLSLNSFS